MSEDKIPKIAIIVIVSILAVGAVAGGYFAWKEKSNGNLIACTEEAKICPDGSAVGRTGPNCEFVACPDDASDFTPSDVEGWKTYRNEEYGFEVKFPVELDAVKRGVGEAIPATGMESSFTLSDGINGVRFNIAQLGSERLGTYYSSATNVDEYVSLLAKEDKTGELIRKFIKEITVDGRKALWFEIKQYYGWRPEVYFQDENNIYEVSISQNISNEIFNKILFTFKFIEPSSFKTSGTVSGKVSIGPLCPVECPEMGPDIYSPLQLIFTPTGRGRPIDLPFYAKLSIDGSYSVELPESNYSVTLKDCAYLGCSAALPKSIFVKANESVQLNIDIDTGIR